MCQVTIGNACRYPGEIIPDLLYLGNWEHAENFSALKDLGIKRQVVTIVTPPSGQCIATYNTCPKSMPSQHTLTSMHSWFQ